MQRACSPPRLFGVSTAPAQQPPVKIRALLGGAGRQLGLDPPEKKDLARHLGKSYVLEPVRFAGTPPMIAALANNELEIANLAYSTLAIAVQNAGLTDLRVISDEFRDGAEGYYSQEYMVLGDGPIKKVEDLKGKVVATNAAGSAVDVATRAMLRKFGLEDKRDYTVVEAPFPTMRAMLAEKKVDIIPGVLPFSLDPELRKDRPRPLFVQRDAIGVTQMIVWTARKPFIDTQPRRAGRFHGGHAAHRALVPRSGRTTRRPSRSPRSVTKQPAERFQLAVHQAGRLPRPEHAAGPRRAAA